MKQKIYPCIWSNGNAKEAAAFYIDTFGNGTVETDSPMVLMLYLHGEKFMFLNAGPQYPPNPSISFFVVCETAAEVEKYFHSLSDSGNILMPLDTYEWSQKYAWVQDRFGVSWQLYMGKMEEVGQKFTPLLMFTNEQAGKAQQAIHKYTSVFEKSSIVGILNFSANEEAPESYVKHSQFTLSGQVFMAMDSPIPHAFHFTEGLSLVVECADQSEIDRYWSALTENGSESMCGWLKDEFGVSWQIVPEILGELMQDPERAPRVIAAFMQMRKFEIEALLRA
ncbi:MAG: VOC family protein [Saprospiraceae bacterium]|nr:VOC family protein [Saprospiraceae bacterium]